MKKMYVIKFKVAEKPSYLYHIDFCNLVCKGVAYNATSTSSRALAMHFRNKYLADAFARLTLGEVEVVEDADEIGLTETHFETDYAVY